MLYKVIHCAGHILANTRPHQLHWGDREMGQVQNAVRWLALFKRCGLIEMVCRDFLKAPSLISAESSIQRSCITIVIVNRHQNIHDIHVHVCAISKN